MEMILSPDDIFLVMGTDGLFESFTSQECCNYILDQLTKEANISKVTKNLVTEAIKRGSNDNVTAIIIFLEQS